MELGPSTVNEAGTTPIHNPYSWNNNASVIFLDQPINVGYSYGDDSVSDTVAASKDVYALLVLFFKQFPEYKDLDFHIAGESYAGHYIPVFASGPHFDSFTKVDMRRYPFTPVKGYHFLCPRSRRSRPGTHQPEVGSHWYILSQRLLICEGNGLTDGKTQYSQFANMACNNSYGPVLSESECAAMDAAYPRCAQLIQSCYDYQYIYD
jgi:cathepsin A (carboxypeptidase C)